MDQGYCKHGTGNIGKFLRHLRFYKCFKKIPKPFSKLLYHKLKRSVTLKPKNVDHSHVLSYFFKGFKVLFLTSRRLYKLTCFGCFKVPD
jgi:hypothetical protein